MKYGKDDEEGEEDGEIRASCFPESNVGLLIDSNEDGKFTAEETAAVKSIVKVIQAEAKANQVRLRTSAEEGWWQP